MADRVGQQMGNYQLIRLLGEGGFAEVYLGEHIHLGTQAAIKVLHTQITSDDTDKFRTEARTVARLIHPNIVRVLEFGVESKTPFLVMDYGANGTLRQRHPRGTKVPLNVVVSYVKQIADALQYAHDEKLIHRDIKPENMLLGRRYEVLLSDFGIALVAQSSRYQNTQEIAGTVAYMSPEQIQGKPRPASDQYSLAVVVYEWLTKDRPFHGSFTEIATQHVLAPPTPLREKDPTISPDVEQVVMTAMAKDPKERFGSTQAFARALEQASLIDVPTIVKPLIQVVQPVITEPFATQDRSPIASLQTELASKPVGTILYTYRGHSARVNAVQWSPYGKWIASGSNDKQVHVWDEASGKEILIYREHSSIIRALAWSPDGKQIASGSDDNTVQVWNATSGKLTLTHRKSSAWWIISAVAWSPDGKYIVSDEANGNVEIWDVTTGNTVLIYKGHSNQIQALAWSPDGKQIASGSDDKTVQVWSAITGSKVCTYQGHSNWVNAVTWSPDGKSIASGSDDKTVQVWDAATGSKKFVYQSHSRIVKAVAWSHNGKYIASGGDDKTVQIWDATTGQHTFTFRGHRDGLTCIAWSHDDKHIASGSSDKTVRVWAAP